MIVNYPPNKIDVSYSKYLFLAGPIQGTYDWQQKIINELKYKDIVITNPRRIRKDGSFDYDVQVEWETYYLNRANIIVFYLPLATENLEGRSYAQTTRFELGEWCAKSADKTIFVCIEEGFHGKRYIEKRILDNYKNVKLCNSYEDLIDEIKMEV